MDEASGQATGEPAEETREERMAREEVEFEAIPVERTFAVIKLYLSEDNNPQGVIQYRGDRIKQLGVPTSVGIECRAITSLAHKAIQEIVYEVGTAKTAMGILERMLGGGDDGEDGGEGERSGDGGSNNEQRPAGDNPPGER